MKFTLCLDCGATNVRAIVVNENGEIVSKAAQANETQFGKENPDFHIWDERRIFFQLSECAQQATAEIPTDQICSIVITTFGVDGALVDEKGELLYPVISWKCPRTAKVMAQIDRYISQKELNHISGVGAFAFNTIYKLIWLKENHPDLLNRAHAWLFISNILAHRLTGVMATDKTMAGTSQLTDLRTGDFSPEILRKLGITRALFPKMVEAGDIIGSVTKEAAQAMGLPKLQGVPVVSAGHDTQFAIFGSGAGKDQPVLSSGTWEILMVRSSQALLSDEDFADGGTAEFDAESGLYNPGLQWLGSGIIEWVKSTCFRGESYDIMDEEAFQIAPGSDGVKFTPDFLPSSQTQGAITGLVLGRTRAHIYRAAMEALTLRLKSRLERLEHIGGFKSTGLILVGGGSKNKIWTQMRADILNLPVSVSEISESTVLGAAMFAFSGVGLYDSPEEARQAFGITYHTYLPGAQKNTYSQII